MNWKLVLTIVVAVSIGAHCVTSLTIPKVTLEDIHAYEKAGKTDDDLLEAKHNIGSRYFVSLLNRKILASESFEFLLEVLDYWEEQLALVRFITLLRITFEGRNVSNSKFSNLDTITNYLITVQFHNEDT